MREKTGLSLLPPLLVAEVGLDGRSITNLPHPQPFPLWSQKPSRKTLLLPESAVFTAVNKVSDKPGPSSLGNLSQQAGSKAATEGRETRRQRELWAPGSPLVTEAREVNSSLLTLNVYYSH